MEWTNEFESREAFLQSNCQFEWDGQIVVGGRRTTFGEEVDAIHDLVGWTTVQVQPVQLIEWLLEHKKGQNVEEDKMAKDTELVTKRHVRELFKAATRGELPGKGKYEGVTYSISDREVTYGKKKYKVMGESRLTVKEVTGSKKKQAPPLSGKTFKATCRECGKGFDLSKFTPYHDICPDCRDKAKKGKELFGGTEVVKCNSCGKSITVSKYDYNEARYCDSCMESA